MIPCECRQPHQRKRIVLTGGPGAGKTAILESIRNSFCEHMRVLPESAGILFRGGFPRHDGAGARKVCQRAIYFVQRELESWAETDDVAIILCDRGTPDGFAYWPGPEPFWSSLGTTAENELGRYDLVIHLRVPTPGNYNHINPLRIESATDAAIIDSQIEAAWKGHARVISVESSPDFLVKARRTFEILSSEMPACCRRHLVMEGVSDPASYRAPRLPGNLHDSK